MVKTTTEKAVIAFDMSSLIFEYNLEHTACQVKTANKVILGSVEIDALIPQREAAFMVMEEILGKVKLRSPEGKWCSIALYNPFTEQFAVDALPNTVAYGNMKPQPIAIDGTYGNIIGGILLINDTELAPIEEAYANIMQALQAHN